MSSQHQKLERIDMELFDALKIDDLNQIVGGVAGRPTEDLRGNVRTDGCTDIATDKYSL